MPSTTCPIWGTPARERLATDYKREIVSPRAGGQYVISSVVDAMLTDQPLTELEKHILTDWIRGQRRDGEDCPLVTSWTLETVVGRGG
jgi:hypothetical protein